MTCETLKRDPEDEITPQHGPTGSVRGVERWYDGVVCSLDQFFCAITPRSNGSNKHKFCSVDLTVFPPRSTGPTCTSRHQAIHVEELWGSLHFFVVTDPIFQSTASILSGSGAFWTKPIPWSGMSAGASRCRGSSSSAINGRTQILVTGWLPVNDSSFPGNWLLLLDHLSWFPIFRWFSQL